MVRSGCFAARLADPQLQHDSGRRIQGDRRSFACCPTSAAADIDDRENTRPPLNVVCYRRSVCASQTVSFVSHPPYPLDDPHSGSNPERLLRPCLPRAARCQRLRAARTANAVWILSLDGGAKFKVTPPPGGAGRVQKSRSHHLHLCIWLLRGGGAKNNHDHLDSKEKFAGKGSRVNFSSPSPNISEGSVPPQPRLGQL